MPPPAHNQSLGTLGESLAAHYLRSHGYTILEMNFKKKHGDIDIVAKEGSVLAFIEVKTRVTDEFGTPEEAITPRLIRSLSRSAEYYLSLHDTAYSSVRLDAVTIVLNEERTIQSLNLYKNISV